MKRFILLFLYLLIVNFFIIAGTSLVYNGGKTSKSLRMLFNNSNLKYQLILTQNSNGKLETKFAPFFVYSNGKFRIGELGLSGTALLALQPESEFKENKAFKEISSPSINPQLSGIGYTYKDLNIAVFTPVLNKNSDLGLLINAENENAFATFICKASNDYKFKDYEEKLQIDWKEDYPNKKKINLLIGGKSNYSESWFNIHTDAFADVGQDENLGFDYSQGFDISAAIKSFNVKYYQRSWQSVSKNGITVQKDGLSVNYVKSKFKDPIYGGTSKVEKINFKTEFKYRLIQIESEHSFETEENTGHSAYSIYKFSLGNFYNKNNWLRLEAKVKLKREEDSNPTVNKFSFTVKDSLSSFYISGDKAGLTLGYKKKLQRINFKATVNQDRVINISFTTE